MKKYVCSVCGYIGKPLVNIFPWLLGFYSLRESAANPNKCPKCEQPNMVSSSTQRGKELLNKYSKE